jgi:hypothetical protein
MIYVGADFYFLCVYNKRLIYVPFALRLDIENLGTRTKSQY